MKADAQTACGYSRGEWGTKPDATAECLTCDWRCQAANAHGVGAQHARKHGHCVRIEINVARIYNHEAR